MTPAIEAKPLTKDKATVTTGGIDVNAIYPLGEFQSRARLGKAALRAARHAGLIVVKAHGRSFVKGSDFETYLRKIAKRGE